MFNSGAQILKAALAGIGLAYLLEDMVQAYLAEGRLTRVLGGRCAVFPGYYLYSLSRRQVLLALALLVKALRYQG